MVTVNSCAAFSVISDRAPVDFPRGLKSSHGMTQPAPAFAFGACNETPRGSRV
jgi:hypothetical protein